MVPAATAAPCAETFLLSLQIQGLLQLHRNHAHLLPCFQPAPVVHQFPALGEIGVSDAVIERMQRVYSMSTNKVYKSH